MNMNQKIVIGVAALLALVWLVFALTVFRVWLKAMLSKAPVSPMLIVAMRLRGMKPSQIVDRYILIRKRGVEIDILKLMDLYQASPKEFELNTAKLADEGVLKKG
jgi:uncharacterized protein YqfA (UPF0365 family)